jgi:hypothetical protein
MPFFPYQRICSFYKKFSFIKTDGKNILLYFFSEYNFNSFSFVDPLFYFEPDSPLWPFILRDVANGPEELVILYPKRFDVNLFLFGLETLAFANNMKLHEPSPDQIKRSKIKRL